VVKNKHVKILVRLKYSITDEEFSRPQNFTTNLRIASWVLAHLTSPMRAGRNGDGMDISVWVGNEKNHEILPLCKYVIDLSWGILTKPRQLSVE